MIVVLIDSHSQVLDILAVQHKSKYCGVKKSVVILCVTCRKVESKKQGWGVMIRLLMPFFLDATFQSQLKRVDYESVCEKWHGKE